MVWPILISVAVTPRISADFAASGNIRQATAPIAPNPMTQRIDLPPLLLPPRSDGAVLAAQNMPWRCSGRQAHLPRSGRKKRAALLWPPAHRRGPLIPGDHKFQSGPGVVDRTNLDI